jgi:hypothetical protein
MLAAGLAMERMTMTRWNRLPGPCLAAIFLGCAAAMSAGCAHSNPQSISMPAREADAMAAPGSHDVANNPTLDAEEIGRRFLELVGGAESRQDLSLERVRAITGLTLSPSANSAVFSHTQDLGGGWFYSLSFIPGSAAVQRGVGLDFEHDLHGVTDLAPVCSLGFEAYHRALQEMGYRAVAIPGEIGELRSWRYHKGDLTLSIILQPVAAGEPGRLCVKSIGTLN